MQLYIYIYIDRRKFRSQTSDNMGRWKAEQGRGREKRKIRRKKSRREIELEERKIRRKKIRRERVRRKKMQMREKVGKLRNTVFFQWFVAPEGRKVGSLKRRVRRQLTRREMKNCTPLWREAHFEVKMYKTHHSRITFGSWDVENVHAVVARSAFPSQHVQNTRGADHFWQLRCRKSARRCGAKRISKSTCTKHQGFGPLLEVQMSLRFTTLHYITLHSTTLHSTTLHYTTLQLQLHNYTPQHSTTLNYTTLHYTKLHSTTLHYITLHSTTLHYTTLHNTTTTTTQLHSTTLHYTKLHYTTLH